MSDEELVSSQDLVLGDNVFRVWTALCPDNKVHFRIMVNSEIISMGKDDYLRLVGIFNKMVKE